MVKLHPFDKALIHVCFRAPRLLGLVAFLLLLIVLALDNVDDCDQVGTITWTWQKVMDRCTNHRFFRQESC
jgi:hypothetical protein